MLAATFLTHLENKKISNFIIYPPPPPPKKITYLKIKLTKKKRPWLLQLQPCIQQLKPQM